MPSQEVGQLLAIFNHYKRQMIQTKRPSIKDLFAIISIREASVQISSTLARAMEPSKGLQYQSEAPLKSILPLRL